MLLKPILQEHQEGVNQILKDSGLVKPREGNDLKRILNESGMGLESVIEKLSETLDSSVPAVRIKGIEMGLKLHKVMEDDNKGVPQIVINITPLNKELLTSVPSIILPREIEA